MPELSVEMILYALLLVHGLAAVVVNATDTPADDHIVGKAYRVLEIVAGVFGYKVKQLPGEAEMIAEELEE